MEDTLKEKRLRITSYNCKGFKFRNYDYLKHLFKQNEIMLLQETWLYEFEHREFVRVLPECQYVAVSAMEDANIGQVGRPYGGCAILYHRDLACSFNPISTMSKRVCAVTVEAENINLVLITVYMPCDDNTDEHFTIYGDVLYEISKIIDLYEGYDIIIGGDFNVDFSRKESLNLNILNQFISDEQLLCTTIPYIGNNWTFENSRGNRSLIDHFIVSPNLYNCTVTISQDGHNLSEHNPITIQTNHKTNICTVKESKPNINDWANATNINIQNYKSLLDENLSYFLIPNCVKNCNNLICENHDDILIQILDDFINIVEMCANVTIPIKKISNKKGIPGWNSFVKPYKEKSIFWNNVWKSAGRPATGQLIQLRRFSRSKYHWAVRKAKRDANNIILNETADRLMNKSFKDFWLSIKRLNGKDNVVAKVVDGEWSDQSIVGIFKDKYECLYSSVTDGDLNCTIKEVRGLVDDNCNKEKCKSPNCHTMSPDIIRNAILSLNKRKDDEIYNISSDHFINASDLTIIVLSDILTAMLKHGTASKLINKSVIKPIPKDKRKSLSDSNNYRAISKNTIISKIIDYAIIQLIDDKMMTSMYQFAYKEGFSTSLCSFLVAETIQYYKTNGSNVFMLSLDASKAFDRVMHTKLFQILIDKSICPLVIRFLINIYVVSSAIVKWNSAMSDPFDIKNGVKQGAVISAPLFAMYVNPLLDKIKQCKVGCFIGGLCANAFCYADDLVLLSPSCSALENMIVICEKYAEEFQIIFNPEKCTLLIFSNQKNIANNVKVNVCGKQVINIMEEKHLGHIFKSQYNISYNLINLELVIKDLKVRTNIIVNRFKPISWQSKVTLFKSQCSSLYGCQLWRLDDPKVSELCTAWKVCCRRLLGVPQRTRSRLLHHVMDSMPIMNIIMYRIMTFFIAGINHVDDTIKGFFKNALLSNTSYMLMNINYIIKHCDMKYLDIFTISKLQFKHILKSKIEEPDWQSCMIKELLFMRDAPDETELTSEEIKLMLDGVCTDFLVDYLL